MACGTETWRCVRTNTPQKPFPDGIEYIPSFNEHLTLAGLYHRESSTVRPRGLLVIFEFDFSQPGCSCLFVLVRVITSAINYIVLVAAVTYYPPSSRCQHPAVAPCSLTLFLCLMILLPHSVPSLGWLIDS
ncbi:hypothetical protein BD779DRAFT_943435 [Infundibulicybe gibba]|nr:hypothetical protein BD779DRAFT_943435 [Infundibulicybe gibba]